ncbi:RNA polymerase sigma factor [Halocola ammonii]
MTEGAENKELIEKLRKGETDLLDQIYLENRDPFLNWITKGFSLNTDEAADLYQDSVIAFFENVRKGKLTKLSVNLQTYLFSIGKNLALKLHRNKAQLHKHEGSIRVESADVEDPFAGDDDARIKAVKMAFGEMDEPCNSILKRYYYFRQSMTEIAEALDYKNADTVKSQKSRCMKHLKQMVKNVLNG